MEDKAAMTISSPMASFKLARGRIKRLNEKPGELGGGGGGDDDEGGEDRPLVEGWESDTSGDDPTKSGA